MDEEKLTMQESDEDVTGKAHEQTEEDRTFKENNLFILRIVLGVIVAFVVCLISGFFPLGLFVEDVYFCEIAYCTLIICVVIAICTCVIRDEIRKKK